MPIFSNRLAEAEWLIREMQGHEGAEGWSADLAEALDRFWSQPHTPIPPAELFTREQVQEHVNRRLEEFAIAQKAASDFRDAEAHERGIEAAAKTIWSGGTRGIDERRAHVEKIIAAYQAALSAKETTDAS